MKRYAFFILAVVFIFPLYADDVLLPWREYLQRDSGPLRKWIVSETKKSLGGDALNTPFPGNCPAFFGSTGLFITFRTGKKNRGCFGAFHHQSPDLEFVLSDYIRGALRRDFRHDPLVLSELDQMEIILTVAAFPEPADDIPFINPGRTGVMIQYEDESIEPVVFVPGELPDNGKLGKMTGRKSCQLFTFDAVTLSIRP